MKNKIGLVVALLLCVGTSQVKAQLTKGQIKERQELARASKKELNEKSSKAAQKEAKRLAKDKWQSAPGALPLEKQLDRAYMMEMQYDEEGFPKYIIGEAMSTGGNYDAAKMQALELAKQSLAAKIQTEVVALIDNNVVNKQYGEGEAESLTKTVMASKDLFSQNIGRIIPIVEMYRVVDGNKREVLMRIAYSQEMVKATAKKVISKELEAEGNDLEKKLDQVLGIKP